MGLCPQDFQTFVTGLASKFANAYNEAYEKKSSDPLYFPVLEFGENPKKILNCTWVLKYKEYGVNIGTLFWCKCGHSLIQAY